MFSVNSITNIEHQVQDLEQSIESFTNSLGFDVQRRTRRGVVSPIRATHASAVSTSPSDSATRESS